MLPPSLPLSVIQPDIVMRRIPKSSTGRDDFIVTTYIPERWMVNSRVSSILDITSFRIPRSDNTENRIR